MDEARRKELGRLLERLGRSIHAAVEASGEVREGVAELHAEGWDAAVFLEATMLRRPDEGAPPSDSVPIHVGPPLSAAEYRLDAADARWLAALGISPTRHRSLPRRALPPLDGGRPGVAGDD